MRILAISGSLQAKSGNLALLQHAASRAPAGVQIVLFDGLRALPHFDLDLEAAGAPQEVEAWRRALADSDAVLIASPEYGRSLPGSLKNAVDWTIGSGELYQKIVSITAAVPGPERGKLGLYALHTTLSAVGCEIVWNEPIVLGPELDAAVAHALDAIVRAVAARRGRSAERPDEGVAS
jgi:chromate reductase, NAD(P)H dehydrogenase (quinone)